MNIEFTIQGKVKAKQSFKIGKNGFKYTSKDVVEYANYVRLCFMAKYPEWDASIYENKALKVIINVFFSIPKTYSKSKIAQALNNELKPTIKPDCDNIAKNINDALNGIVFPDDKQIACLQVNKHYAKSDYVNVSIETI